eukprot:ctg_1433.g380
MVRARGGVVDAVAGGADAARLDAVMAGAGVVGALGHRATRGENRSRALCFFPAQRCRPSGRRSVGLLAGGAG